MTDRLLQIIQSENFKKAYDLLKNNGAISVCYIQRKFQVTYEYASQLLNLLESINKSLDLTSLNKINLELLFKNTYGRDRFYPLNEDAKHIARLLDQKALTREHLLICKEAGWKIQITTQTIDIEEFLKH